MSQCTYHLFLQDVIVNVLIDQETEAEKMQGNDIFLSCSQWLESVV